MKQRSCRRQDPGLLEALFVCCLVQSVPNRASRC
jgi:hypothetical protein